MSEIVKPQLPSGWNWQPLDSLADVLVSTVDKKTYENENCVLLCNYTDVYYSDRIERGMDFMPATASQDQIEKFSVLGGDVVITKDSESSDDIGRPAFVPETLPGVVYGYHLAIYRPFDTRYGRFIRYLFESAFVRAKLEVLTPGVTRVGLGLNTLRNLRVPVPDPEEALWIADYLDHETAEIDALIDSFEDLISLMNERISAWTEDTIWQPGTERIALRRIVRSIDQGESPIASSSPAGPGESGVLKAGCTNFGVFNPDANKRLDANHGLPQRIFVKAGDLLVTRASGSQKHVGSAAIVPQLDRSLAMSDKLYRMATHSSYSAEFLALVMKTDSYRSQLEALISGAEGLAKNISITSLKTLEIPLVGHSDQREMLDESHAAIGGIESNILLAQGAIDLAKERRAALISAAVTGQIDVTKKHTPVAEQLEAELAEAR